MNSPRRSHWSDAKNCTHAGLVRSTKNGYEVIDCNHCGFCHSIPIPDEAVLRDFYEKKYYQSTKPDYAQQHADDRLWWDLVYRERYARFEKLRGTRGRILDIGSGPGFFLATGMEIGWDVVGIEPSEHASEYARGLGVQCFTDTFTALSAPRLGIFDVIQINQAIEHIPNPGEVLELCRTLLVPGGLICIIAANDFNPIQDMATKIHGVPDWWVIPPEHVNYFSMRSLSTLVERCGFEIKSETATFPIDLFLLMGDNYINDGSAGKQAHQRRKNLEFALRDTANQELKEQMYRNFAILGLGREVEVIGRRGS